MDVVDLTLEVAGDCETVHVKSELRSFSEPKNAPIGKAKKIQLAQRRFDEQKREMRIQELKRKEAKIERELAELQS